MPQEEHKHKEPIKDKLIPFLAYSKLNKTPVREFAARLEAEEVRLTETQQLLRAASAARTHRRGRSTPAARRA